MKKPFLPKKLAWIFIIILVYIDAVLDIIMGKGPGNPLWTGFAERFGAYVVLILAIPLLFVFYALVKILAKIVVKIDKTPDSEEILATALVVVYAIFDLWLILADFFNFTLIQNFRYTIPFLIIGGLIYALWAEHVVRRRI